MGNFDPLICLDYGARDHHSFDWVGCEGQKGWSAAHVITPFFLYIFSHDFILSWFICGVFELFECTMLTTFGLYFIFNTLESEKETSSGQFMGDWLLNDLMGIICAMLIVRILKPPPLLPKIDLKNKFFWKQLAFLILFIMCNMLPTFVLPPECTEHVPKECWNIGIMLDLSGVTLLLAAMALGLSKFAIDYRYLWKPCGYTSRKINCFLLVIFLFVFTISIQNFQPIMPMIFDYGSDFYQVWIVVTIWVFVLSMILLHRKVKVKVKVIVNVNVKQGNPQKTILS